jgi:hypothetical protein
MVGSFIWGVGGQTLPPPLGSIFSNCLKLIIFSSIMCLLTFVTLGALALGGGGGWGKKTFFKYCHNFFNFA